MVQDVSDLFREAIYISASMVVVIILPSLIVGVIIAMFQAATQISEQTLSFLPRLLVTFLALIIAGPWLGGIISDFTRTLIIDIHKYIH